MNDTRVTGRKIVIVEDEAVQQKLLSEAFQSAGFTVITAANGKDGLEAVLRDKPDIVTLDIAMPEMNGLEMLKKLREDPWGATVPVVVLSNFDDSEKVAESLSQGVQYYLVKINATVDDIVKKVQEALAQHEQTNA